VVAPKPWKPGPAPTWPGYSAALRDDPEGVAAVLDASGDFFLDRTDLAWAIELESGWDPAAINKKSKAAGLIQMMPETQDAMKVTHVEKANRTQQAPVIRDFFTRNGLHAANKAGNRVAGDALLAIFAPAGIGKPDSYVLFPVGSPGWKANPSYRPKDDGPITAGSVRRVGTPRAMRPRPPAPPKGPPPKPGVEGSGGGGVLLAILLVGGLVLLDDAG